MSIWRLKVNTAKENIAEYCKEKHVAAMGWSLTDIDKENMDKIQSFSDYCRLADTRYDSYDSVKRLAEDVQENDLIWMRSAEKGQYYIGRVTKDSHWKFEETGRQLDAANQLTDIDWKPCSDNADEESIPGAVATAFIGGSTFQRIRKDGIEEYSKLLFNKLSNEKVYDGITLEFNQKTFFNMLQPEDVEDLVAIWLCYTKNYITVPSSNKTSTPKYECVLLDPKSSVRKHIYIQVKKGEVDLDAQEYMHLVKNGVNEVYLLTTEGNKINEDVYTNVYFVNPTDIFEFATDEENANFIPESIFFWGRFLGECENERLLAESSVKGIMFDTNRTYSETNEKEMFLESKIAAYGDARRYINSFSKGDYALFYSKGRGIIGIGRIKSDNPSEVKSDDDIELYHDVEMIVPIGIEPNKSITPAEIKKILGRNFFWASTIKSPFLDKKQVDKLIVALKDKYER